MVHGARLRAVVGATVAVLGLGLGLSPSAEAHGHGFHGAVYVGGFYGWGPYWGGWGPWWGWGGAYWGPYYPEGGVSLGAAMAAGFGAIDLDVKPNRAEVWADGKYVAEARDLDGNPSYLWLKQGPHHLVVYHGGYKRFEEDVEVHVGMTTNLKVRLEKGESEPPRRVSPPEARAEAAGHEEVRHEPGELRLRILPDDASVYVDDEFRGPAQEVKGLRLEPGKHRVEVARPGFRTVEREVEVEAGHPVDLEVLLERP
ncbi:MAG TPA: PEGA domain-containing protein [Vicinamibacteria bacterium]|nr:PEGA domain-containing protein [Vicinamibacteria bacterium]